MTALASQTQDPISDQKSQIKDRRRVLMLTHRLPYPPDRGDRIRSYNLLKLLARHFDVAVACTSDDPVWLQHHHLLRKIASRVAIQPISRTYTKLKGVAALAGGQAVTPACHYRVGLAQQIIQWHETQPFDAVLTFCTGMVEYARLLVGPDGEKPHATAHVKAPVPRHVLDLVDVDSFKWRAYSKSSNPPMSWVYAAEARRLARVEAGKLDHFDAVTVISAAEAQAYREHVGPFPNLHVVGNGVDLNYFAPLDDPSSKTIVFVGVLNYRPNSEGITWFAQNVMPLLRQKIADARLLIVGRHPTPKVMELNNLPGVQVVGSVPDVRTHLREASAVIAPLQIARGVQNKVLEALACTRAVVCSPAAAEGIHAADGQHLLVADKPEQWAGQLERVLTDAALRRRLASAGRELVERDYNWDQCLSPMVDLLAGQPTQAR